MNVIEIIKAVFIGIIQGITEWLPISSTGHMILFNEFVKLNVSKTFLDMFLVVIQLGSILAVVCLYFNKLNPFSPSKTPTERAETFDIWLKVIIGCVPAAVIGFLFDDVIHKYLYSPVTVAVMLILYGVLFILIENMNKPATINSFNDLTYKAALLIGIFQVLALVPGTSRSGATILGAVILGASRFVAAEYSFFLAIPVMFGASAYEIIKYVKDNGVNFTANEIGIMLAGFVTAFAVSIVAIKLFMGYIRKHDFKVFGYYRIILGVVVLIYFMIKGNWFGLVRS